MTDVIKKEELNGNSKKPAQEKNWYKKRTNLMGNYGSSIKLGPIKVSTEVSISPLDID